MERGPHEAATHINLMNVVGLGMGFGACSTKAGGGICLQIPDSDNKIIFSRCFGRAGMRRGAQRGQGMARHINGRPGAAGGGPVAMGFHF